MIRPEAAAWFEIIAARDDAALALESLASAGCAEIEPIDRATAAGELFARITGWTSDRERLRACLERSAARALVHFPPPPEGMQPPILLHNPGWVQPFEIFTRMVGMPGRFSADPSGVLTFVAPVIFGYMFGDVVQGAVLVVLGLLLQRRQPMLRLLIAGGLAAIAFGFVFGSAASVRGAVPALWVEPLDDPLAVLIAPIVLGALILALGLALNGFEAWWRGAFARWLAGDAGFLLVYAGILLTFLHRAGPILAVIGLALYVGGRVRQERRAVAALTALGELLEKSAQILINTLSFVRVGAFALAHAGLSSALAAMAVATGNRVGYAVLLVIGNVVIIAIEVLVASIQTTRLVLFEFFTRFFTAGGREFHPLPSPSPASEESAHESKT